MILGVTVDVWIQQFINGEVAYYGYTEIKKATWIRFEVYLATNVKEMENIIKAVLNTAYDFKLVKRRYFPR